MKSTAEYINDILWEKRLKKKDLADIMGVSTGAVTHYLQGVDIPNDTILLRLAKFVGDPPEKILLIAAESRAPKESQKIWERIAKASGFNAIALFLLLTAVPAEAASSIDKCVPEVQSMDIMSNRRKNHRRRPSLAFLPA